MCAELNNSAEWQNKPWLHKSDQKKVHLWFFLFFCGWRVLFIWPLEHYSVFTKCFNFVYIKKKTIKAGRYCCQVVSCDHGLLDFNRFWFFFYCFALNMLIYGSDFVCLPSKWKRGAAAPSPCLMEAFIRHHTTVPTSCFDCVTSTSAVKEQNSAGTLNFMYHCASQSSK